MAACVAEAGFRTLLVDLDPQCNATVGLGLSRDLDPNTYTCLLDGSEVVEAVRPTSIANLSVVASTPHLAGATVELPRIACSETRLREAVEPLRGRFDQVVLDCPPSLG